MKNGQLVSMNTNNMINIDSAD